MSPQEGVSRFDPERGVFVREVHDLSAGVRTRFEENVLDSTKTRLDTSRDGQLRTITQTEDSIGYEVAKWDIGVEQRVSIMVDARTRFAKYAYFQTILLDGEKEQSLSVVVGYDGSTGGKISSIVLRIVPKTPSADKYGHLQGDEKATFFNGRTFGENMDEIAEVWGLRGEKAFLIIDDNYQGKGSDDQETRVEHAISSAKYRIFRELKDEKVEEVALDRIFDRMLSVVSRNVYDKLIGKLPYNDCRGIMDYLLAHTSEELANDPKSLMEGGELAIEQALEKGAAQSLTYYSNYIGTIGQSRIQFMSDRKNPNKFQVETESIDEEQGLEVRVGEEYSNGEYGIAFNYSESRCIVSVKRLIGPKETIVFSFPRPVDIEDLGDQISQDQRWPKFIKSLNLNHSSVQLQE